jgi:hypothetical protein
MKKLAISLGLGAMLVAPSVFAQERPAPPTGRIEPEPPRPAPPTGRAEPEGAGEREFGNPGVIAFGAATSLNFGYTSVSPPQGSGSTSIDFGVQPDIQYFVIEGLSLGGTILFDWSQLNPPAGAPSTTITTFGIGPTVGYNLWLSPGTLSLWPQVSFFFENASGVSTPTSGPGGTTGSASGSLQKGAIQLFVPLEIHPAKHFHLGIGPYFALDVLSKVSVNNQTADSDKDLVVGIKGEIGGWL